ncbi:MAG TPA: DUF3592 domain-containing protein [Gammaproteobacteria bacterium]|nr:DUF3592 domain-containing protein [Gammaproteobacteria bacterium]
MTKPGRHANPRLLRWLLLLFAALSLVFGIRQTQELRHLQQHGLRTPAEVVAVDIGARGARMAVLRFRTQTGELQETRDMFRMYLVRYHAGDSVTALYDPQDPGMATVDNGPWMWQEPGLLLAGFVFLAGLWLLVPRWQAGRPD